MTTSLIIIIFVSSAVVLYAVYKYGYQSGYLDGEHKVRKENIEMYNEELMKHIKEK